MKLLICNGGVFFGLKIHMIKSIQLLEENIVECLQGLEIGEDFLSPNHKNMVTELR